MLGADEKHMKFPCVRYTFERAEASNRRKVKRMGRASRQKYPPNKQQYKRTIMLDLVSCH